MHARTHVLLVSSNNVDLSLQGISQAFGLTQTQVLGVGVSGVATDTFNILWPQSTNQVTVGFVVVSSSNSFAPEQVPHLEPHFLSKKG